MKHFLQKYLFRRIFFGCLLSLFLFAAHSILINIFLKHLKPDIEQRAAELTGNFISIGDISYLPPAYIILKNISIRKKSPAKEKSGEPAKEESDLAAEALVEAKPDELQTEKPSNNTDNTIISIKKITLALSLPKLIAKRQISINNITINQPRFDYAECFGFIKENFEKIKAFINSLPEDKIYILLKKAVFYFVYDDKNIAYVNSNIAIEAKGSSIAIAGISGLEIKSGDNKIFSSSPMQQALRLRLTKTGLLIDSAEFARKDSYVKLWGYWENHVLRINSLIILSPVFDLSRTSPFIPGVKRGINFYLKNPLSRTHLKYPAGSSLIDASLILRAMNNTIKIENLFFTIKNTPFGIKGEFSLRPEIYPVRKEFSNGVNFNLTLSSYPNYPQNERQKNPKIFDLTLQGKLLEKKITGKATLLFLRKKSPIKIKGNFINAGIDFSKEKKLNFSCDELSFSYPLEETSGQIPFRNFNALISTASGKIMPIEISSLLYDGTLKASGYLDKAAPLSKNALRINLANVEANKLSSVLVHLSKVYGKADADITYQGSLQNRLSGTATISDGRIENFEFLKWLANFFALPQLSQIHFKQLSTSFSVDDKTAKLENIILDSKELPLKGYFQQASDNFVASKISLQLSRQLLESSEKFRPVLNILGEGFSSLDFDFQLSGSIHKLNFMWLDSEFKNKLKARIPNFIERGIERKIEASLKTPPENNQASPPQTE